MIYIESEFCPSWLSCLGLFGKVTMLQSIYISIYIVAVSVAVGLSPGPVATYPLRGGGRRSAASDDCHANDDTTRTRHDCDVTRDISDTTALDSVHCCISTTNKCSYFMKFKNSRFYNLFKD